MRNFKFLIFLIFLFNNISAQCISGNCVHGIGKIDLGFGIYDGKFDQEKPNGYGTIERIDGVTYAGNWENGMENGEGMLIEKGRRFHAVYFNGNLLKKIPETYQDGEVADNSKDLKDCIRGDCYSGLGKLKISEEAHYEGYFKEYLFNGRGKIYYSDGSYLDAHFEKDEPKYGVRFYAQDFCYFEGDFYENGTPKTGKYTFKNKSETVEVEDGYIKTPKKERSELLETRPCPNCEGSGNIAHSSLNREYVTSGSVRVNSYGNVTSVSAPQYIDSYKTTYSFCSRCGGDGFLYNKLDPPKAWEK